MVELAGSLHLCMLDKVVTIGVCEKGLLILKNLGLVSQSMDSK